jgi:hypothetical protein
MPAVYPNGRRLHTMKKIMLLVFAVFALAGAGLGPNVAAADNGANTTPFMASYTDPVLGPVVCSGVRIVKTAPHAFIKDSEDCTILNGFPAGTFSCTDVGGWFSDFDGMFTLDCTLVITDNGDGTSNNHIVAYY